MVGVPQWQHTPLSRYSYQGSLTFLQSLNSTKHGRVFPVSLSQTKFLASQILFKMSEMLIKMRSEEPQRDLIKKNTGCHKVNGKLVEWVVMTGA